MFPSLTQSPDTRRQKHLVSPGPMPDGPSGMTRQAAVSPTHVSSFVIRARRKKKPEMISMADLALTGQVGQGVPSQGELELPASEGKDQGCRFLHRW